MSRNHPYPIGRGMPDFAAMAITVARVRAAVLGILTLDVLVLLVTGVVLFFEYHPSLSGVWDDYFDINPSRSYELARATTGVHRVAAFVAVPLVIAAAVLIVAERWPRNRGRSRRAAVAIGLGLVATVLFGSFTGPLLAWDQLGLWAVTVGADWSGYSRLVLDADEVRFAIVDGAQITLGTLVRWLVVHTVVVGALLAVLLVAAWRRSGRGAAPQKTEAADETEEPRATAPPTEHVPG